MVYKLNTNKNLVTDVKLNWGDGCKRHVTFSNHLWQVTEAMATFYGVCLFSIHSRFFSICVNLCLKSQMRIYSVACHLQASFKYYTGADLRRVGASTYIFHLWKKSLKLKIFCPCQGGAPSRFANATPTKRLCY